MPVLDHWHPVLPSRLLKDKPVGVCLDGRPLALFRNGPGTIGALDDCCVHRRMRLSLGTVDAGRLRCRYHGWTYDACGHGESPGTPKLLANAEAFETKECHGAVWVRAQGAKTEFPDFDVAGHYHLCTLFHTVKAPLELVVDNFTEIEHTPTTHAIFGYALDRMHEVQVRFEPTDTSVRVINHGPSKPISPVLRLLLGIRADAQFNDDWTTFFSPVYSVYDHWFTDPKTGKEGKVRWRLYIFFTPVGAGETSIMTFAFTKSAYPGPAGGARLFKWLMKSHLSHEIDLDVNILESLADQDTSLEGMKLSRFDRTLGLNRERIHKIYRGRALTLRREGPGDGPRLWATGT